MTQAKGQKEFEAFMDLAISDKCISCGQKLVHYNKKLINPYCLNVECKDYYALTWEYKRLQQD